MEEFKKDLCNLINKHSLENGSETPDHILADYLVSCLKNFNETTVLRMGSRNELEGKSHLIPDFNS